MRLDLGDIFGFRLCAVKCNARSQLIAEINSQIVHDPATETETNRPKFSRAFSVSLEPFRRRVEVFCSLGSVELAEHLGCNFFLLVRSFLDRITAERRQRVGCESKKVRNRQSLRNVTNVRVEATVFVNNENGRKLALRGSRTHQITLDRAVALWRLYGCFFGFDAAVVCRNNFS